MPITLNGHVFDPALTKAHEYITESAGGRSRTVKVSGVIADRDTVEELETALDAVYHSASRNAYDNELSLREGRRLWVRCIGAERRIGMDTRIGMFELILEALDLTEESVSLAQHSWTIEQHLATRLLATSGTAPALPVIALTAIEPLVAPRLSDGVRTLAYSGTIPAGNTLRIDANRARAFLNDEDITPYIEGDFPKIDPPTTSLVFDTDPQNMPVAQGIVEYRHRWW